MSKVRVHELAKELGVSSKEVLAKLSELGEFVKSASSTEINKLTTASRNWLCRTGSSGAKPILNAFQQDTGNDVAKHHGGAVDHQHGQRTG